MTALVDSLAEQLSRKTGSQWEILRGRPPLPPLQPHRMVPNRLRPMRYGLRITRDGHSHTFQANRPMTLSELTRWLASIADMINMGFIR